MSAVAHPSKLENMIYTLFPIALAIWVIGMVPWFAGHELEAAAAIAAFLTLLLFESGLDEWFAKNSYRRMSLESHQGLRRNLLSWNARLRSWDVTFEPVPLIHNERVDLNGQVDRIIQSTVSSQIIASRLWRVRSGYFLQISLFFIVDSIRLHLPMSWFPDSISVLLTTMGLDIPFSTYTIAFAIELLAIATLILAVRFLNDYRNRNLRDHIYSIASFYSLQKLITYDWTKNPENYKEGEDLLGLKQELERLGDLLFRGHFNIFIELWRPLARNLGDDYSASFEKTLPKYLITHWARHIEAVNEEVEETSLETGRSLGWLVHYAWEYSKLFTIDDQLCKELVELLSQEYEASTGGKLDDSMQDPAGLYETLLRVFILPLLRKFVRRKPEAKKIETEKMKMNELNKPNLLVEKMKTHNVKPIDLNRAYTEIYGKYQWSGYWDKQYPDPTFDPITKERNPDATGRQL